MCELEVDPLVMGIVEGLSSYFSFVSSSKFQFLL